MSFERARALRIVTALVTVAIGGGLAAGPALAAGSSLGGAVPVASPLSFPDYIPPPESVFRNVGSLSCMTSRGYGVGSPVVLWSCDSSNNQEWFTAPADSGYIRNAGDGLCISDLGSPGTGAGLYLENCNGSANQTFGYGLYGNDTILYASASGAADAWAFSSGTDSPSNAYNGMPVILDPSQAQLSEEQWTS